MFWEVPQALGGPVLAWELARGVRHTWLKRLRIGYTVWLLLQCFALFSAFDLPMHRIRNDPGEPQVSLQEVDAARTAFLNGYLLQLLQQQLLLLVLLIPALTAGSLGQEKERGTLFALFGTELTSSQIVLGKLLGRLALIAPIALTPLPALVLAAAYNGREMIPLFLALAQEAILLFALGAACLLFAIRIRQASDAILASYALLGLAYLASRFLPDTEPVMRLLDPATCLDNLFTQKSESSFPSFLLHLADWSVVGTGCLVLAAVRLRRACLEQGEKKPSRRLWAFRPPVGNNPIRWRERYVIGLAPLPFLRVVPRWLALLGVFTFSTVLTGLAADSVSPGFVAAVARGQFAMAFVDLRAEKGGIVDVMSNLGLVFIVLAEILVGVRCGTSVAEEKRRNTWDDLLLTAQSFREITRSKMWGVLGATVPYIIAYALPVFALAALGGDVALVVAGVWVILPCAVVLLAALLGMEMLRVPAGMGETRKGGAFYFESEQNRSGQKHRAAQWRD